MSGHTPGPWHYEAGRVWRCGDYEDAVAYMDDERDGHLIAAALDLLEAIEGLIPMWESGIDEPWVSKAREAIKKAKGE